MNDFFKDEETSLLDSEYYDNENMYTPLIDNSKIMVYNFRNSVIYYCLFDFTSSLITYFILVSNVRFLYIFYISIPIIGYIGSNYCNVNLLMLYNCSILLNIIFKFIFFFQFTSIFKIIVNLINIVINMWTIKLINKFVSLIKKLSKEEINSIINKDYTPEYKINFIYY
tara:strand:+ start:844 stop:1350 length:507 start_codon:yes stop_codon:yes gene_type:complete